MKEMLKDFNKFSSEFVKMFNVKEHWAFLEFSTK